MAMVIAIVIAMVMAMVMAMLIVMLMVMAMLIDNSDGPPYSVRNFYAVEAPFQSICQ